ncbi:MAG TPA: cytochrome c3 family protein [Polyangiaceae bacterium]|nr:cytochrome c3 family protein [Polyangiaceae bacterium]
MRVVGIEQACRIPTLVGATAILLGLASAQACGVRPAEPQGFAGRVEDKPSRPPVPPSRLPGNVEWSDYEGSDGCEGCHWEITAAWRRSPMHRMTRNLPDAEVRAPFDAAPWRFKSDTVVLERRGQDRFVQVRPAEGPAKEYRVTRVLGGRTREDFVGVDVAGGDREVVLPVSYVFASGTLRYKGYSVMVPERATLRAGPDWSRTCIFCHNTVPEIDRLIGAVAGERPPSYQGEQVDRWMPADRQARVRVTDAGGFARALSREIGRLEASTPAGSSASTGFLERSGATPRSLARAAIEAVRSSFDGAHLVEVGVGCEACHGGARAHALDPRVRPSLTASAPWLNVELPSSDRSDAINRVCARCHQVLFSRYPFTWEGGRRDALAGGSHIASGEARDFLLGACSSKMACTDCHDPHAGDPPGGLRAMETSSANPRCTRCHSDLADAGRLRAHSHHDPGGPGRSCIACHMPRKNMGLDGTLTRYHRIGSPTDAARVLGDRPLECALCHVDRTVRALADSMQRWWPVRYPSERLEELYGSLDANVMRATLERGKPHEKVVAIAVLAERGVRDAAPRIARELLSEYPLVREWAHRALTSLTGRCNVDLAADDETIAAQARASCAAGSALPTRPNQTGVRSEEDPED